MWIEEGHKYENSSEGHEILNVKQKFGCHFNQTFDLNNGTMSLTNN